MSTTPPIFGPELEEKLKVQFAILYPDLAHHLNQGSPIAAHQAGRILKAFSQGYLSALLDGNVAKPSTLTESDIFNIAYKRLANPGSVQWGFKNAIIPLVRAVEAHYGIFQEPEKEGVENEHF